MDTKTTINKDGSVSVFQDCGQSENKSRMLRQWDVPASQVKAHLATFADKVSTGDFSAMRDAAEETAKKSEE